MQTVRQNLEQAHILLNYDIKPGNGFFKNIYKFTNENINEMFDNFDIEGKKCLTVLGSGDQTLDLLLRGASSVTAFDVNPLTKHYLNLKIALLNLGISEEEYMQYLCWTDSQNGKNYMFFNKQTYEKIRYALGLSSMLFWNKIYDYHDESISVPDRLFKYDENKYTVLKKIIRYLDEQEFEQLKKMLKGKKIEFINSDITSLKLNLNEKYDFIYLSNIITYTKDIFKVEIKDEIGRKIVELKKFENLIKDLSENLNPGGKIIVGYLYEPDTYQHKYAINDYYSRSKVFTTEDYEMIMFRAVDAVLMYDRFSYVPNFKNDEKDACIVYTKK